VGDGRELQIVFFIALLQKFGPHLCFTVFLVPLTDSEVMAIRECAAVGLEEDGTAADGTAGGSMQKSGRMVVGGTFVPAAVVV
jgi:hypothetical protein